MKFNFNIKRTLGKVNPYHIFFAVALILLLSYGYVQLWNDSIEPEVLFEIKNHNPSDSKLLDQNRIQVLFMQERIWFFIVFSMLVLSVIIWISLSNRRQARRTFVGYIYNLAEKLDKNAKEKLDFQERLQSKFQALTANDLLLAEMLINGLTSKQISTELNISPPSVNTARYRLRKRMMLKPDDDLIEILQKI
ncbi:MAG TPA: LuxR C-terminal-related transcriptional regulator [Flavobacteriaceae bacterium]|nr:LuxR C-terminal-related transcriptional regulator [Flavobacteriaceae bacterium]